MCLTLTVRAPSENRGALAGAVEALPSSALAVNPPRVSHEPRWPWARQREPEAIAPCICAILTDDADWNAPTWAMRPDAREPLAETLEALATAVPDAEVEVLWAGDKATHDQRVTPAELAALTRAGALGTKTRYLILPANAGQRSAAADAPRR